jgi:hypothetical protein
MLNVVAELTNVDTRENPNWSLLWPPAGSFRRADRCRQTLVYLITPPLAVNGRRKAKPAHSRDYMTVTYNLMLLSGLKGFHKRKKRKEKRGQRKKEVTIVRWKEST